MGGGGAGWGGVRREEMGSDRKGLGVPKVGSGKIQRDGLGLDGTGWSVGCDGTGLHANGTRPQ